MSIAPAPHPAAAAASLRHASLPGTPMGRDDILRLGQSGSAWVFLPLGLMALRAEPGDHQMRFLTAAGFAKLMLVNAAREHLAVLPAELRGDGPVPALATLLEKLPDDRINPGALSGVCRANVEALAGRPDSPVDLCHHLAAWEAHAAAWEWFRTRDGNVVRREAGRDPSRPEHDRWMLLQDVKGQVGAVTLPHPTPAGSAGPARPYVLEGMDPPWLVERVLRETPAGADGYQARVTIVQEDPLELLDGLAQVDLRGELGRARVRFALGPGAAGRLAESLHAAMDTQITGPGLSMSTVRTKCSPTIEHILQRAQREQVAEQGRLLVRVEGLYGKRDRAWWRRRFAEVISGCEHARHASPPPGPLPRGGGARPLRILIPTCRYSTYIQHASADLAAAFTAIGCGARVLIEPDSCSQFSGVAYLRAVAELEPDLVVLINYSRANINGAVGATAQGVPPPLIHPNIPYIMWVQDAMPHQLDERVGRSMGELDLVAGNLPARLFTQCGFPRDRALDVPIVASNVKFHDGEASAAQRARHGCEVAYVSHQSETPAAMHARKRSEAHGNPGLVALIDRLWPLVQRECAAASDRPLVIRLRREIACELQRAGGDGADAGLVERLIQLYAMPVADRLLRHQTLEWAAEASRRRGWRMHLYGKGWADHPTLSGFAQGELGHGDDLRASYRCARAHVQVSAHTIIHQRVFECALAGGLPIARLTEDDLSTLEYMAALEAGAVTIGAGGVHDVSDPWYLTREGHRRLGYPASACAAGLELIALRGRLGLDNSGQARWAWLSSLDVERLGSPGGVDREGLAIDRVPEERSLWWLYGDPAEYGFVDAAGLERLLARAVEDDRWRSRAVEKLRGRVRERLTHEAFARRLVEKVASSLAG